jgi:transposase
MDARTKKIIESETDPRILQVLLDDAVAHIEKQKALINELQAAKLKKDQSSFELEERVKLLRRMMFGKSSEKRLEGSDRPRDKSQIESLEFSQAAFPALEVRDEKTGKAKGRDLEAVVIEFRATEEELASEAASRGAANATWIDTGLFDESFMVQIIERKYVREIHRKFKYKLKTTNENELEKEVIVTASGKPSLLPGMNYTTEFVASVVSDKFISHMPLERQTREMESLGLKGIKNSTLSRMTALSAACLEPMAERILYEDLLPSDLAIHLDETPWKIQNKHEKDGYMWIISNRYGAYYFFKPTRSGQVLKEKLGSYNGPALTDGFSGYSVLEEVGIEQAFCWAHARREFLRIEGHDPTVKPILDLIDQLFAIEREATSFVHLAQLREEKSAIVAGQVKKLLFEEHPRSRSQSQKRKAIEYTLKRWEGLTRFLKDTRIPMSNNEAERTIRHAVVGRKNFYGSGSHTGAATAATLYTIIESAKKNDIDPRVFVLMCLRNVAEGKALETPLAYARRTRSCQTV